MSKRHNPADSEKRFACDRCHAQKLRCLRDDVPGHGDSCARCLRANVRCIYSPSERLGRPPEKSKANHRSRKSSAHQRAGASVSSSQSDAQQSRTHLMDWTGSPASFASRSPAEGSSWMSHDSKGKGKEKETRPTSGYQQSFYTAQTHNETFSQSPEMGSGINSINFQHSNTIPVSLFTSNALPLADSHGVVGSFAPDDYGFGAHNPLPDLLGAGNIFGQDFSRDFDEMFGEVSQGQIPNLTPSTLFYHTEPSPQTHSSSIEETTSGFAETKGSLMAQLPNLASGLSEQLRVFRSLVAGKGPPNTSFRDHVPAVFDTNTILTSPIGETFKISERLIYILKSVPIPDDATSTAPISHHRFNSLPTFSMPSNERGENRQMPQPHNGRSHQSPPRMDYAESPSAALSPAKSYTTTSSTSDTSPRRGTIDARNFYVNPSSSFTSPGPMDSPDYASASALGSDISNTLLTITCYVRLFILCSVTFAHCSEVIAEYASEADRVHLPQALPDCMIGNFKPANYSNVHISIIIETMLGLIRQVEQALEISEGAGSKDSVSEMALQLIDVVMKEEGITVSEDMPLSKQLDKDVLMLKELIAR